MKKILLLVTLLIGLIGLSQDEITMRVKFKNANRNETEVVLVKIGSDTAKHYFVKNKIDLALDPNYSYKIAFYNSVFEELTHIKGLGSSITGRIKYEQKITIDWKNADGCKYNRPKY